MSSFTNFIDFSGFKGIFVNAKFLITKKAGLLNEIFHKNFR